MAAKQEDFSGSGSYPRQLNNRPDFADQRIAEQHKGTEYSWEKLPPARRREVMALVNRSRGQRRARRVAIISGVVLVLLVLGGVAWYLFSNPHLWH